MTGLVEVYTGNGKGKTTISLGLALRAVASGMRVIMVQFIKAPGQSGEEKIPLIVKGLDVKPMGAGFVGIMNDCLPKEMHIAAAQKAIEHAGGCASSGGYDLVILDEVNVALSLGLISMESVLKLIKAKHPSTELILTGRNAPKELMMAADLVSELVEVKHPFATGVLARKGIEY